MCGGFHQYHLRLYRRLQFLLRGAAQDTYRWVNVRKLCELLLPKNTVVEIKYFTALVRPRRNDPDQAVRQQLYFRALQTLPGVAIHLGHFCRTKS